MMYCKKNLVKNTLILFLSAVALVTTLSCSNLFSDGQDSFNVSGIFIRLGGGAGRTAIPTVSDLTYYSALVPQGATPTTIQPMTQQGDGYLVNLTDDYSAGSYTLYVYGFSANASSFTPAAANVIASDTLNITSGQQSYSLTMTGGSFLDNTAGSTGNSLYIKSGATTAGAKLERLSLSSSAGDEYYNGDIR